MVKPTKILSISLMETTPVDSSLTDVQPPSSTPDLSGLATDPAAPFELVSKEETPAPSEHVFLTTQMVIVTSA